MLRQIGRASRLLSSSVPQRAAFEAVRALPASLQEHVSARTTDVTILLTLADVNAHLSCLQLWT